MSSRWAGGRRRRCSGWPPGGNAIPSIRWRRPSGGLRGTGPWRCPLGITPDLRAALLPVLHTRMGRRWTPSLNQAVAALADPRSIPLIRTAWLPRADHPVERYQQSLALHALVAIADGATPDAD